MYTAPHINAKKRPNFIFIMADDLGYADLGCYGGRGHVSPHLDRMAAEGMRFTQAYANSPVCSPTRFALMTGRYQYRLRGAAEEPLTGRTRGSDILGLPPEHPTLPSLLKQAGYYTALIGKWHLGFPPHFGPLASGYDFFYGVLGGGVDYFTHCDRGGKHDLYHNEDEVHDIGYLTDLISDRAVETLRATADRNEPFLLSVHYTAPHWPWETRDDADLAETLRNNVQHTGGGSILTYQRMIHHMDEGIGRLFETLKELGMDDNTIVVFTSDNGGERFSDTWPLVGKKMELLEGGIRVPLLAWWPGRIEAGKTSDQVTITMDWVATFLHYAKVDPHPDFELDGMSLNKNLSNANHLEARTLFWRMKHMSQRAMREGHWKYLAIDDYEYLFDLSHDERERANRAPYETERLQRMRNAFATWEQTQLPIPAEASVELVYGKKDMP